jgi:hypothetical protein
MMQEIWRTREPIPRKLEVKGISAVDPDCLVAYLDGQGRPLWIVESSGLVVGLSAETYPFRVYAHRVFE